MGVGEDLLGVELRLALTTVVTITRKRSVSGSKQGKALEFLCCISADIKRACSLNRFEAMLSSPLRILALVDNMIRRLAIITNVHGIYFLGSASFTTVAKPSESLAASTA